MCELPVKSFVWLDILINWTKLADSASFVFANSGQVLWHFFAKLQHFKVPSVGFKLLEAEVNLKMNLILKLALVALVLGSAVADPEPEETSKTAVL